MQISNEKLECKSLSSPSCARTHDGINRVYWIIAADKRRTLSPVVRDLLEHHKSNVSNSFNAFLPTYVEFIIIWLIERMFSCTWGHVIWGREWTVLWGIINVAVIIYLSNFRGGRNVEWKYLCGIISGMRMWEIYWFL